MVLFYLILKQTKVTVLAIVVVMSLNINDIFSYKGNKYGTRYNYVSIIEDTNELKLPSPVPNLPVCIIVATL